MQALVSKLLGTALYTTYFLLNCRHAVLCTHLKLMTNTLSEICPNSVLVADLSRQLAKREAYRCRLMPIS